MGKDFTCQLCDGARHRRPFVHRDLDGEWWTVAPHLGWSDATAFADWDSAFDHGLVLSHMAYESASGARDGVGDE